jgi:hypothetical protein
MDALSDCLAALETDPRYTRAYMKKADVLTAVGDFEGYVPLHTLNCPPGQEAPTADSGIAVQICL